MLNARLAVFPCAVLAALALRVMNPGWGFATAESTAATSLPRGAHPDLAPHYKPSGASGEFRCVDGSASIPWNQVNDDYCDCADGSDEPGTSACANGRFYCANAGHAPKILQSSRVNDGICDCCDGGDEWDGDNACQDECFEMGAAARAEAEKRAAVHKEGFAKRQQRSAEGKAKKDKERIELEDLRKNLETANALLAEKETIKEAAEEVERAALDKHNEKFEKLREEREAAEKAEDERQAADYFAALDSDSDGRVTRAEFMADALFDQNGDGAVSEEEAGFYMSGADAEAGVSADEFAGAQWRLVKPLILAREQQEKREAEEASTDLPPPDPVTEAPSHEDELTPPPLEYRDGEDFEEDSDEEGLDSDYDDYENLEEEEEHQDASEPPKKRTYRKPGGRRPHRPHRTKASDADRENYDEETRAAVDAAEAARSDYEDVHREVRDTDDRIKDLEKSIERDYGADDEFSTLHGQCFELDDLEYTYRLCPFDYCEQKPKHGGGGTRLGSWDEWILDGGDRRVGMSFTKGVTCWNGPARSTKVYLECGSEDRVVSATEPSKCEYQMTFETPSACRDPKDVYPQVKHDEL